MAINDILRRAKASYALSRGASSTSSQEKGHSSSSDIVSASEDQRGIGVGAGFAPPTYQDASGAPIEEVSPLGTHVTSLTSILLNIGMMIGTGVFSTPASILTGVGSIGLSLIYWTLGFIIAIAQLAVYLELSSYFPNRAGAEVVYLEQGYPRPKYLAPTAFAVLSVVLSFSSSNCIVAAKYLFQCGGLTPTAWEQKGLAVGVISAVFLLVVFSTKTSLRLVNVIGIIKIITLLFISITGLVVLGGHTKVEDPTRNFRNAFEGTNPASGYGLSNALVKVNFAYTGYLNAFNVVNEIKDPIKTLRKSAPLSLLAVAILYLLVNIAYFAAVDKAALKSSTELAASLFFQVVFGTSGASRALNFLIALSAFGNIIAVIIGSSRIIRECARQGVLPFPSAWASTKPFGTPLFPYLLKWGLTVLMILAPPAGDAFNFIVDLQSYPSNVFLFATTFGLFLIRRRRKARGIVTEPGLQSFRAWDVAILFSLAVNVFLLVMPWYPPPSGRYGGDVSFWYATYCVTGLGILALCIIYHVFWIYLLPHFGNYTIQQEMIVSEADGSRVHHLVKVPNSDLERWKQEHREVEVGGVVERLRVEVGVEGK